MNEPVTVAITRTVLPGREDDFETLVRVFIPKSLTYPGHLGVHVVTPAAGTSRKYHVVIKFATGAQWRSFQAWPDYLQFRAAIEPLLEWEPCVEEMSGLESWFTLPETPLRPLPKWKMALVTLLGVYPTSLLLGQTIGRFTTDWHFLLSVLVFATSMVVLLTWIVMPLLTRVLHRWLHPQEKKGLP